jgi:TP901 family phage tail tape measure protein
MDLALLGMEVDARPVRKSNRALDEFARSGKRADGAAKGFEGSAARMGATVGKAAAQVAALAAAALSVGQAARVLAQFDESMAQVKAISGATEASFKSLRDEAKKIGGTTEFSATQAAQGLTFLSMAGLDAEESVAALADVVDLATVSSMGLQQAADGATNVLGGFNMEVSELSRVIDVMAKTSTIANTSVAEMVRAFETGAAPAARNAGIEVETVAAALGALADAGVKSSRAGTALNAVFTKLQVPTAQAETELARFSLSAEDIDVSTRGLIPVLQDLADAEIDTAAAAALVGLEHNKALDILLQAVDKIRGYEEAALGAAGASSKMAEVIRDQLGGDFKNLVSAAESLVLALGDAGLTAVIRTLVQTATAGLRGLATIVTTVAQNADYLATAIGLLAATRIPALIAGLRTTVGLLTTIEAQFIAGAVAARGMAMAMKAIPFAAIVYGVTEVIQAYRNGAGAAEKYRDSLNDVREAQNDLDSATSTFYDNMTRKSLEAMRTAAEANVAQVRAAISAAEENARILETKAKLVSGFLYADDLVEARREIDNLRAALVEAEARLSATDHAASNFERTLAETDDGANVLARSVRAVGEASYTAVPGFAELTETYGSLAFEMREVLEAQNALAVSDLQGSFGQIAVDAEKLGKELGLTTGYADTLKQALRNIAQMDSLQQQALHSKGLAEQLLAAAGSTDKMGTETRAVYETLLALSEQAANLAQRLSDGASNSTALADAAAGITAVLDAAAAAADRLASALGGVLGQLGQVASGMARVSAVGKTVSSVMSTIEAVGENGLAAAIKGFKGVGETLSILWSESTKAGASVDSLAKTLETKFSPSTGTSGSSGSSAAAKAKEGLDEASTAAEGFAESIKRAVGTSVDFGRRLGTIVVSGIDSVAGAFGDFIAGGLKDFEGFADSILDTFRNMLSQMIALAARNVIMISLGLGGGAMQGGGLLGGLLGGNASGGGTGGLLGALGGIFGAQTGGSSTGILGGILGGGGLGSILGIGGLVLGGLSILKGIIGSREYYGSGIQGTLSGQGAEGLYEFDFFKGSGLKSSSTNYRELSADIEAFVNTSMTSLVENIHTMGDALGLATDGIEDISGTAFTIWTNGKDGAEIEQMLAEEIAKVGDKMAELVLTTDEFSRAGESALDTLTRLSSSLMGVNATFDLLGRTMLEGSLAGGDLASSIVDAFGGLEQFDAATTAFYNSFFTEAEQMANLTEATRSVFTQFNEAMPTTREEYRNLMLSMDLTTERGREMFAAFMGLSDAMDTLLPAMGSISELVQNLIGQTSGQVDEMIASSRDVMREAQRAARDWFKAADRIEDFIRGFDTSPQSSLSLVEKTASADAAFRSAMESLKAGEMDQVTQLPAMAQDLLTAAAASSRSLAEYRRVEGRVRNQMELARGIAEFEGSAEEAIAAAAERQIAVLEELKEYLQSSEVIRPRDLRQFERELGSLDKAIATVRDMTFNSLQDRIDLVIKAANRSDLSPEMKILLKGAADGIRTTIDLALRSDELSPAMRFIVLNGESQHTSTLRAMIRDPLSETIMREILTEQAELTRMIRWTMTQEDLPEDVLGFAMTSFAELRRDIRLAVLSRDPAAIELALMQSDTVRRVFEMAVNEERLTGSQRSLLHAITGNQLGTVTLRGGFEFNASDTFSTWFEDASRDAIQTPMDRLRSSIDDLIDAVKEQRQAADLRSRVSALNEYVDANLIQNDAGQYFVNHRQRKRMAQIAGIDTRGMGDRQVLRALRETADYDLLEKTNHDPGGHKQRRYRRNQEEGDGPRGFTSKIEVDDFLTKDLGNIVGVAQEVLRTGKIPEIGMRYKKYLRLPYAPEGHALEFLNDRDISGRLTRIVDNMRALDGPERAAAASEAGLNPFGVPGFARGGLHRGGLRIVGENGPELEATGAARIYSSSDTRAMLDNREVVAELRRLRREVSDLRDENTQLLIAGNRNTKDTRRALQKFDIEGLPPERSP